MMKDFKDFKELIRTMNEKQLLVYLASVGFSFVTSTEIRESMLKLAKNIKEVC